MSRLFVHLSFFHMIFISNHFTKFLVYIASVVFFVHFLKLSSTVKNLPICCRFTSWFLNFLNLFHLASFSILCRFARYCFWSYFYHISVGKFIAFFKRNIKKLWFSWFNLFFFFILFSSQSHFCLKFFQKFWFNFCFCHVLSLSLFISSVFINCFI